jgi:alcohol dehydrogenase class IV
VTGLADRQIEMVLRNRVLFGAGALRRLPELIADAGGRRAFVVTDPGVVVAGIAADTVDVLSEARIPSTLFSQVEPNPSAATVEAGASILRTLGLDGTVIVALGGGSAMDAAKAIALCADKEMPVW